MYTLRMNYNFRVYSAATNTMQTGIFWCIDGDVRNASKMFQINVGLLEWA